MKYIHRFLNSKIIIVLLISFILFISKWYYFILTKRSIEIELLFNFIFDSKYWVPYIKYIAEFNLNNSFDPFLNNLKILPIPLGSLFVYSIFFKLFDLYSLIIVEFFAIFLFLIIFTSIFNKITSPINSILCSLVLVSSSKFLFLIDVNNFYLINTLQNIYSLRPHRPVFSNIFFYLCIYILIKEFTEKESSNKNLYYFSFFMGLIFSSFYYFFIILLISFILLILLREKNIFIYFFKKKFVIIKAIFLFLIASIPFILNLIFHESDVSRSAGLINLDISRKLKILNYYKNVILEPRFILILLASTLFLYFLRNSKHRRLVIIFYIIFISSIISPLLFFILSPKSGLIYHFNNNIILSLFLLIIFSGSIIFFNKINLNFKICYLFIFLLVIFNIFFDYKKNIKDQNKFETDTKIQEFVIVSNNIKNDFKNEINNSGILTFDSNFMIFGILNNFKYINMLNHMWAPKTYKMLENDLIKNFKFLNLKQNNLEIFFQNNFENWRYFNEDIGEIFGYRYQANSLLINDFDDFGDDQINNFIINSPPNLNQQIAITIKEKKRILNEFNKDINFEFRKPEIIIINLDKKFLNGYLVDMSVYCQKYMGNFYSVYYLNKKNNCE